MKAKLKTELVPVEYWDCGKPDHRHKTESVAQACIDRFNKSIASSSRRRSWTYEAYAEVLKEYRSGVRLCDIARTLGLSSSRVGVVIHEAERAEKSVIAGCVDSFFLLSTQARNCLRHAGYCTIDEVRSAFNDGRLDGVPRLGKVGKYEIQKWLNDLSPS